MHFLNLGPQNCYVQMSVKPSKSVQKKSSSQMSAQTSSCTHFLNFRIDQDLYSKTQNVQVQIQDFHLNFDFIECIHRSGGRNVGLSKPHCVILLIILILYEDILTATISSHLCQLLGPITCLWLTYWLRVYEKLESMYCGGEYIVLALWMAAVYPKKLSKEFWCSKCG